LKNKLFGLIGFPLGHSFSRAYFSKKFEAEGIKDCSYELFPIEEITHVKNLIESRPELKGFNVTIPYKEKIIPFLTTMDQLSQRIGAVNVVLIDDHGALHGYNSDYTGFIHSLSLFTPKPEWNKTKALVFGTGGSSKAVTAGMSDLGIECRNVSRNPKGDELRYQQITPELLQGYRLLINCTPLGMYPDADSYPAIPYESISSEHMALDLVYNPEETVFMRKVKEQGGKALNGLPMLVAQAEKAWEIWNS
jgi:shikimate dehydrogenase